MTETEPAVARAGATAVGERIVTLDVVRGVAVLGILLMNVVSFGLDMPAYFNLDAASPQSWLDWTVGIAGEVLVDQKFMGLFSMLFGAGIVLFADRAVAKGAHPVRLSLWRNFLLFLIGMAHAAIWEGDVLIVYAICSPVLLAARRLGNRTLLALGGACMLVPPVAAPFFQSAIDDDPSGLGGYWLVEGSMSGLVEGWFITDVIARALGMMLIGVAAYRSGFLKGGWTDARYRRIAAIGLGTGLPLATASVVWVAAADFDTDVAIVGSAPNTLATPGMVAAYVSLIVLWHRRRADSGLARRFSAAGRMALTNYLTQTLLGVGILTWLFEPSDLSRSMLIPFVVGVWALQLWWSPVWLGRFRSGPAETVWRAATYRRW